MSQRKVVRQRNFKEKKRRKRQVTKDRYQPTRDVHYVKINVKKNSVDKSSIRGYFSIIREHLNTIKSEINVLETLHEKNVLLGLLTDKAHKRAKDNADFLENEYDNYFDQLERKVLENGNVKYCRILQVPFSHNLKVADENKIDLLLLKALSLSLPRAITHITNMMKNCPKRFQLYLTYRHRIPYNFMTIDSEYVLSEYPRFNNTGVVFPDEMYVNCVDSIPSQMTNRHDVFKSIRKENKEYQVDINQLRNAIENLQMEKEKLLRKKPYDKKILLSSISALKNLN